MPMGTGETTSYHLRRIGPSATCMSISNIMKLKYGVTKFGRATSNDYYLDSTKLKNFISRIHAEIHAIPSDNGDMQFQIVDKGLNGTFINDTKMSGPYILKIGDKVTFGHTNGYKLKAGDYAKQPNSEFQFIFEKLVQKEEERGFRMGDEAAINGHTPINSPSSANTITSHSIKKSPTDQKFSLSKNSTVAFTGSPNVNRYPGFDIKSSPSDSDESDDEDDDDYKPISNTRHKKSYSALSRYDDSDESMDSSPSPKSVRRNTGYQDKKQSHSKVKKSADRLSGENGFTPLSDLARKDKTSKTKTSRVNVNININVESTVNSGSRTSNSMRERDTPPSSTHLEIPSIHRRKLLKDKQRRRSSSSSSSDSNDLPSPDEDSNRDPFFFSSGENSDMKTIKKKSQAEKKADKPAKVQRTNSRGSVKETTKKRKQPPIKTGKPGRRGRPPKKKKRDSDDDDDDDFDDDDDDKKDVAIDEKLEEGVEWFEEDKCASDDCKRPKGKRVAWVCCDDCDEWYHTECVGCRYDHVKDSNIKFSCGCR
ncbi:uncharacterized protein C01G6.5-like isoform X2 [Ostrea edulis]|uniref:uncharacterized protein C01G6.5-like isoform X2 n=1 Tax=Ostrea edulis TaxID=37623 RepID=UPI00209623C7|nr:uncharacterized protein C01G6.5-like isoform X2 [Ostrea edulis]